MDFEEELEEQEIEVLSNISTAKTGQSTELSELFRNIEGEEESQNLLESASETQTRSSTSTQTKKRKRIDRIKGLF